MGMMLNQNIEYHQDKPVPLPNQVALQKTPVRTEATGYWYDSSCASSRTCLSQRVAHPSLLGTFTTNQADRHTHQLSTSSKLNAAVAGTFVEAY